MTLHFFDGFDSYDSYADMTAAGWVTVAGSPTLGLTDGRFGGGALLIDSTDSVDASVVTTGSLENFIAGASFYFTAWPSAGTVQFFSFRSATDKLFALTISSTGILSTIDQGNATSGSQALSLNTWYRIEVDILLNSTASGTGDIRVNGSSVFTVTARDTAGSGGYSVFRINGGSSCAFRVDDFTYIQGDATAPNTFLGDIQIDTLRPTADGTHTDWTANTGTRWEAIDDPNGSSDGDTTYLSDSVVGNEYTAEMSDVTAPATTVHAFQIRALAKKENAGAVSIKGLCISNAVEGAGVTVGPTTSYAWTRLGIFTTNPDGGGALSDAVIDALEAGFEVA